MRCWHSRAEFKDETVRRLWLWRAPFGVCVGGGGHSSLSLSVLGLCSCGSWRPASQVLSWTEAFSGLRAFCYCFKFWDYVLYCRLNWHGHHCVDQILNLQWSSCLWLSRAVVTGRHQHALLVIPVLLLRELTSHTTALLEVNPFLPGCLEVYLPPSLPASFSHTPLLSLLPLFLRTSFIQF